MTNTILFAFVAVALVIAVAAARYYDLVAIRARRRTAWELERAEWRAWMARP